MAADTTADGGAHPDADREIIDFGAHVYTDRVPFRPSSFDAYEEVVPFFDDVEELVARSRAAGITGGVAVAPEYCQLGDPERTAAANDVLQEVVDEHDHFVGGLAAIPFIEDGEAAAAEFERCLEAGFVGGVLETWSASDGIDLTDDAMRPVFDVAEREDAPILVHPKATSPLGEDVAGMDESYRFGAIFGREVTLATSICRVVHDGVLDRHPDLQLVYDHAGGNIASMLGRLEYQYRTDRWPGEFPTLKPWDEFRAQLEDRIALKLAGYFSARAPLRATLEEFPASKVLFGTDFPFEPRTRAELREAVDRVDDLTGLGDARRILAGNARDLV